MASNFDRNPFDKDDDDINPFSNHGNVHVISSKSKLSTLAPEPRDFHNQVALIDDTPVNLKKKQRELQAKEAELNRREEIVKRKEEALAKAGVVLKEKNWPPFFPIIHHDVSGEIPVYLQRLQYIGFGTFLGVPVCLLWNLIANVAAWISGTDGRFFFLAIIYLLLGPLGAYYFWYRSLYRALRTNNGTSFGCFFFNYLFHIGVFIFAAIGPPIIFNGLYFAGIMTAIDVLPKHPVVGILYFIGFGLFTLEAIISIYLFQQVYKFFRGRGVYAESRRTTTLSYAL